MRSVRAAPALLLVACAGSPGMLDTHGAVGDREAWLGRLLLIIAAIVVIAIGVLVVTAVYRRRAPSPDLPPEGGGSGWILIGGVIVPTVILVGVLIASTSVLAAVSRAPRAPAATVRVIGHRWWWEVRYIGATPGDAVTTANELHLPVGRPVRLELATSDVIHSFWVPQLGGKMDLIPGQVNVTWIEADSAGSYWGRCAEYCGAEHAEMALTVVAQPPAEFQHWLAAEREPAAAPEGGDAAAGAQVFAGSACALCHAVRGTGAGGAVGPDLTHLASRETLAAGMLPNTPGHLAGWIANPQAIKPGVQMPVVPLRPDELRTLVAYLRSLH